MILNTKVLKNLDKLIIRQAQILRKVHCYVVARNSSMVKKEIIEDFKETIVKALKKGEYKEVVAFLLMFHAYIEPSQAWSLYSIAQDMAKIFPDQSTDLLEFLHLRLLSSQSNLPQTIDYQTLPSNQLLVGIPIKDFKNMDVTSLSLLLEDAIQIGQNFWESKLKGNYKVMILDEIDQLVNSVFSEDRTGNHLQFFKR